MTAQTPGQASWTARVLRLEGNPGNPDDYAEITSWWDRWLDDEQRAAEEAGAQAAVSHVAEVFDPLEDRAALGIAVRALREIAWGATPELKPVDPSVVADKALAAIRRLGVDMEARDSG